MEGGEIPSWMKIFKIKSANFLVTELFRMTMQDS
jgi:hypothetical protein